VAHVGHLVTMVVVGNSDNIDWKPTLCWFSNRRLWYEI